MPVRQQWQRRLDEMTVNDLRRCALLWQRIWPQEAGQEQVVLRLRGMLGQPAWRDTVVHGIDIAGQTVALARSFVREIGTVEGRRPVLGLAGVCTLPECRGGGLGREVVAAAFARLRPKLPVCLFQTGVPAFYLRLGSREIHNPIVNSSGEGRAFWDPHAMIHPTGADWPEGEVDLLGPGW